MQSRRRDQAASRAHQCNAEDGFDNVAELQSQLRPLQTGATRRSARRDSSIAGVVKFIRFFDPKCFVKYFLNREFLSL